MSCVRRFSAAVAVTFALGIGPVQAQANYPERPVKIIVPIGPGGSYDLRVTIFDPATPLHDGAVVIKDERIAAASVFLPLTKNPEISRELGTRHRAAIGITEGTDAISIVVSEETGLVTWVEGGRVRRNVDTAGLRKLLFTAMGVPLGGSQKKALKNIEEAKSEAAT